MQLPPAAQVPRHAKPWAFSACMMILRVCTHSDSQPEIPNHTELNIATRWRANRKRHWCRPGKVNGPAFLSAKNLHLYLHVMATS